MQSGKRNFTEVHVSPCYCDKVLFAYIQRVTNSVKQVVGGRSKSR